VIDDLIIALVLAAGWVLVCMYTVGPF